MHTEDIHSPYQNYASSKKCECELCFKVQNQPAKQEQTEYCIDIGFPNQSAYKFICDQIANSPFANKLNFNIIDTFFFEGKRISGYYHNDQSGRMVKSHISGVHQIQRILRDHQYVPLQAPALKRQRKIQTAKEAVNRKIKNNIGIMILNDGTYRLLNQLNISYQINTAKNVSFIKSYHTFKLIPIYYKLSQIKNKEIYKRARVYLRTLNKQITPFEINYIKKEEEYFYEQDLYNQDIHKYLLYLTCKICQLVLMQQFYLIRSGVFVWAVNNDSAAVYIGNLHNMRYTVEKNPNQILDKFINSKKQLIQRKLESIGRRKVHKQAKTDNRVLCFQQFLKQSFRITLNQMAPKIDLNEHEPIGLDQAFKKLHPNSQYNLSDIVSDNTKFNKEMKRMFDKHPYKRRVLSHDTARNEKQTKTNSFNINYSCNKRTKDQDNLQTTLSSRTIHSSRTPKSKNFKLQSILKRGEFTSRRPEFKFVTANSKTKIKTEQSNKFTL